MYVWVEHLAALRRAHPALSCGAEQVLASSDDWIIFTRDSSRATDASCANAHERVLIAIHRGPNVASTTVPIGETLMSGCQIEQPYVASGTSSVVIRGSDMKVQIQGDDVLIAACQ